LPIESEDLARALYEYRQEALNDKEARDFSNTAWYKEVPELGGVNFNPALITNSSDLFRIESEAQLNDIKMTTTAVVQRVQNSETGKWYCKVLSWKTQ
jgi:hypothetical protein